MCRPVHVRSLALAGLVLILSAAPALAQDAGLMLRATVFSGNLGEITRLAADKSAIDSPNADGLTALMIATGSGDIDGVRALLAAGANVKAQTITAKATAMMFAVRFKHPEIAKVLAEKGAEPVSEAAAVPEADLKRLLDKARNEN
jgi:ankyrin repeat protein